MLLSDQQIALNEVLVLCEEAADHYREAADLAEETGLAETFRDLAQQRRQAAEALAEHIRALGGLPRAADADRETVSLLVSRIKAALSADPRWTLLEEGEQAEAALAEGIAAALRVDLPDAARALLQRIQGEVEADRQRLAAAKAR